MFDVDGPGGGREMRRLWELEGPGVGAGGEEAGGEDICCCSSCWGGGCGGWTSSKEEDEVGGFGLAAVRAAGSPARFFYIRHRAGAKWRDWRIPVKCVS